MNDNLIMLLRILKKYDLYIPNILYYIKANIKKCCDQNYDNKRDFAFDITNGSFFRAIVDILWLKKNYEFNQCKHLITSDLEGISKIIKLLIPERELAHIVYVDDEYIQDIIKKLKDTSQIY